MAAKGVRRSGPALGPRQKSATRVNDSAITRRKEIDLTCNELFELRGKWSPLKASWRSLLRPYVEVLSPGKRRDGAEKELADWRKDRRIDREREHSLGFAQKPESWKAGMRD